MLSHKIQEIWFLFLIILLHNELVITQFSPDTSDFDAYGLKIAANDIQFVQAWSEYYYFLVQYAPYNYTFNSLQCYIDYDDSTHYVYSVGVGIKQDLSIIPYPYFYFAGEVLDVDLSGNNGTYIGIWSNWDSQPISWYISTGQYLACDNLTVENLQFISSFGHQEFFVIAVEPYGQYAIGLATDFAFIYYPFDNTTLTAIPAAQVWPNNTQFNPYAADTSTTFTIVAGLVQSSSTSSRVRATPTVYLLSNTNLTILSTWSYTATNNSWQSHLTYSGTTTWNSKYTMSVKINPDDSTRVLIGMPFLNTVFLFVVSNNGRNLTLASSMNNGGQTVGYGKSVTWLTDSEAAILVSSYTMSNYTWISSNIYLYTSLSNTILPPSPSAVFPNSQQPLPSTVDSELIDVISTPESLAVLDPDGNVILIVAEPPGYYAATDTDNSPVPASMPVVSYTGICIAGTYKSNTGVNPCTLCPSGSSSSGGSSIPGGPSIPGGSNSSGSTGATSCNNCSSDSFCPLGAVYEVDSSILTSLSQAYAYPTTPDLDVFEDILITNMFSLGSTSHCLVVSPMFWTLMLLIIFVLLILGMASLNWCVQQPKRERWRSTIKSIFIRTDLIGEGELWVGGLASLIVILITAMAYWFGISYLNQYPSEKVGPSNFACDTTIRNAKFDSSLQALAVPISDEEQPMFDMLNNQNFTLQIDFINTVAPCQDLSISQVVDTTTTSLNFLSCSNLNGTLSVQVFLPEHSITIVATINDVQLIGGIGLGVTGPGLDNGSYILKELNFRQTFYTPWSGTLGQQPQINMALTKVVNQTEPLAEGDSEYGGIWYPTFTYSLNQMFLTANGYATSTSLASSTTLTIVISETSYYIQNDQSPIAKESEVVFRTLLFSFICLELCGMLFLIINLLLIPLFTKIARHFCHYRGNAVSPEENTGHHEHHEHH